MSFVVLITDTKTYWDEENDWNLLGLLLCQSRQVIPESLRSGGLLSCRKVVKLECWNVAVLIIDLAIPTTHLINCQNK